MPDTHTTPFAPAAASRLVGAYVIDLAILAALLGITWFVYFTPLTMTLITIEAVLASAIMLGATGRTPGMAAMKVCLIRDEGDAQTPSLGSAIAYTAMNVGLQLTVVGPLAAFAMVNDGHTWLTGPTRTRLVDLRKHAALAAGPGDASGRPAASTPSTRAPCRRTGGRRAHRLCPSPRALPTAPRPVTARTTPTVPISPPLLPRPGSLFLLRPLFLPRLLFLPRPRRAPDRRMGAPTVAPRFRPPRRRPRRVTSVVPPSSTRSSLRPPVRRRPLFFRRTRPPLLLLLRRPPRCLRPPCLPHPACLRHPCPRRLPHPACLPHPP